MADEKEDLYITDPSIYKETSSRPYVYKHLCSKCKKEKLYCEMSYRKGVPTTMCRDCKKEQNAKYRKQGPLNVDRRDNSWGRTYKTNKWDLSKRENVQKYLGDIEK